MASLVLSSFATNEVNAQQGQSPVAPSSTIGPVTDAPTLSLLGMQTNPGGSRLARRNDLWFGATQSLGGWGNTRFSAIASGNWAVRDAMGANGALEGTMTLRARGRVAGTRAWSAVSYGYANLNGAPPGLLAGRIQFEGGADASRADTTISSRVDIGNIGRAEAGVLGSVGGVELSFGLSVERSTRVTTQTLTIDVDNGMPMPPSQALNRAEPTTLTRTVRGMQRRDVATGIAAMGFNTGAAAWLVSVTAPVASHFTSDGLAPRPTTSPAIASVAVVQPLAAWLSVIGAASTSSGTLGSTVLRDDIDGRRSTFAPVVALGLRISRLPFGNRDNTPNGILAFETRTVGAVDSLAVTKESSSNLETDTLRVQLFVDAPRAESVELMGDATQWVVTQMQRTRGGRWRMELKLAPGVHRLVVRADGGKWSAPPGYPIGNDDFGSPVGMIIVSGRK